MPTESWDGHTHGHIKAPWERGDAVELHGFQTPWKSQFSMHSRDSGAVERPYQSFLYSVGNGVGDSRQMSYFSEPLPYTNPYFANPDLNYSFRCPLNVPSMQPRDPIPPPWDDNANHAPNTHHLTNPYLHGYHDYNFVGSNSSSIRQSYMSEAKARSIALNGNGVKCRDRRSVCGSDERMSPLEAPKQPLMKSLLFDSVLNKQDTFPKYTKARSLLEEVIETVVKKMVCAQSRPNMVSDIIFNPSNVCRLNAPTDDGAGFLKKLMQRILVLQLRQLGPKLMDLALNEAEFERQKWALNGLNKQISQDYPNPGFRLLCMQQRFMDIGMEAFDVLAKLRSQIPCMASEDGRQGTGILRIAVIAGNPSCSALGSHLFFLQHCSSLEIQTDLVTDHVGWEGIVEAISVKGLGMVSLSFMEAIRHPTCLRSYRIIFFMNSIGENLQRQEEEEQSAVGQWDIFWNSLYQNTCAMVLVVVYETCLLWDEIKPRKGLWWFGGVPEEELVHIVRKV